ncbi:MAG: hypothetical protein JW787_06845 [Sedimentisphaerales bacterium]|nr:hypothetical protein [Sedimentisphaerales bacterium]
MILNKYSFGIGDRFGHQGKAQLSAMLEAKRHGLNITPVWNKSHREHTIIGSKPSDTRQEADKAVKACSWDAPYYVDADHINLNNVNEFIEVCDFFTIDVADYISSTIDEADVKKFIKNHERYTGTFTIPGIKETFHITKKQIKSAADKYLPAVKQAGMIYRHIVKAKGADNFITEVSMDETDQPQSPIEMLFILAAVSEEGIPAQTIAPKFTGRFNKGVDYVGNIEVFAKEFEEDLAVTKYAVKEFGLPENLKLSIHSGSDKFSIYKLMSKAIKKFDAGLHLKTAGTTWLEELIGLAMAGGKGLAIAKQVYKEAFQHMEELCVPYASVINISRENLPSPEKISKWDSEQFANALRHDQSCPQFNPDLRQLLHVGYKIAAKMGTVYTNALEKYEDIIAANVTENIYERHIKPLFHD